MMHPQYNQYQYWLEGFDDDWSAMTGETYKSYTWIPEGSYTFKVRGKNIYDEFSELASYTFNVSPPVYRHYLAYGLYSIALIAFIVAVVKWRSAQLERANRALKKKKLLKEPKISLIKINNSDSLLKNLRRRQHNLKNWTK